MHLSPLKYFNLWKLLFHLSGFRNLKIFCHRCFLRLTSYTAKLNAESVSAFEVFSSFLACGHVTPSHRAGGGVCSLHYSVRTVEGSSGSSIFLEVSQRLFGFGLQQSAFKDLLFSDGWRNWLDVLTPRQSFNCLQITESVLSRFLLRIPLFYWKLVMSKWLVIIIPGDWENCF